MLIDTVFGRALIASAVVWWYLVVRKAIWKIVFNSEEDMICLVAPWFMALPLTAITLALGAGIVFGVYWVFTGE